MTRSFYSVITAICIALAVTGCYRPDVQTIVLHVPQMGTTECMQIAQQALGEVDGLVSAQPNLAERTLTVTYNTKQLAIKNIEYVLVGIGFDVNGTEGREEARQQLPPECR